MTAFFVTTTVQPLLVAEFLLTTRGIGKDPAAKIVKQGSHNN